MKRKIVQQGYSTLMISLPSAWARKNNLHKGDEVDVEEDNSNLIVSTDDIVKEKKEIVLDINEHNNEDIKNILTHIYRKGFDKIILKGNISNIKNTIKRTTNKILLGFEITDIEDNKIILENISEPTQQKYEVLIRRIFLIIKESLETLKEDYSQNRFDNIEDIKDYRTQQDKFILFCRRIIIKEKEEQKHITDWELLTFLMHIEHKIHYLYKYLTNNKITLNKQISNFIIELEKYFDIYYNAYFKEEITYIHKINRLKNKFHFGECMVHLEKSKNQNNVIISHIIELFRLIQIATSPILSKILEKENNF